MSQAYIAGIFFGLTIGMAILLTAYFRRKHGEYLDDPKHRKWLIAAFVFFGLGLVCVALLIFATIQ